MDMDENQRIFTNNLKHYVNLSKRTQSEIAKEIGVSFSTFNSWYRGVALPRMGKVELLARLFNVSISDLLEEHTEQPSYYVNDDAKKAAQLLFDQPEYKVLFDAVADVKPEDIEFVAEMIKRVTNKE